MCGIIAVLRRANARPAPTASSLRAAMAAAEQALGGLLDVGRLDAAAAALTALDQSLRGVPGVRALVGDGALLAELTARAQALVDQLVAYEARIDGEAADAAPDAGVEARNRALVRLKDALWAVRRDRLSHAAGVGSLCGGELPHAEAAASWSSLQLALDALDRLEVRGRDSAGVSLVVSGVDPESPALRSLRTARDNDPLLQDGSVRAADGCLVFVYKHAAEIGELGDNVRALRTSIVADRLLREALRQPGAQALVLGHTRWASVGIISEANCHPVDQAEVGAAEGPFVLGALNGDVDNHHDLVRSEGLRLHEAITTDTKVIPVLVSRRMATGLPLADAFRRTVGTFTGSVAIAAASTREPHRLALALRGSGQALYVGCADDLYVVASEPYGVVEECARYLRMDGETPANADNPTGSRGQVVVLDRDRAGEPEAIARASYDGTPLPVQAQKLATAAVTTRDIDRSGFRHFLHKEISESPLSLQKTLRGRIVAHGGRLRAALPDDALPPALRQRLAAGAIARVLVIGQGTAAVAGQAVAGFVADALARTQIATAALPATELSGFGLRDDLRDTLVIAVSQSGTTTDTNRTVDLVRQRGAAVLAIVNRRGSDLCDKADGVLFTSDGRDVEMSVASTKAFYAQCAAGQLLALALARAAGCADDAREHELLAALRALPAAMRAVLAEDPAITAAAEAHAPLRRSWALVGNGRNRVAAAEVRIKLSELCYKSIACDATEDKKHIDLSTEPLVLVCAAGLSGSTADDVAKEVAIFKAHKACPIVIATAGEARFAAAAATIHVPAAHPAHAFLLATMAGHLFGYRAALAIDGTALPLRRMRGAIEATFGNGTPSADWQAALRPHLLPAWAEFQRQLATGRLDGALEARTAARLVTLCHHALGFVPLDAMPTTLGESGGPGVVVDRLTEELTRAIDQLTRPVDAIKHQAKTVTVGISRADEEVLQAPLVQALLAAGAPRDRIGYRDLRALAGLDPTVAEVLGSTRYRIDGDVDAGTARIEAIDQRGVAAAMRSRTAGNPPLRGTKHLVAVEKQCFLARGRSDDRTVILVPEVEQNRTVGMTLLHVRFRDRMDAATLRSALGGYRHRYAALVDAVTETEPTFDEGRLAEIPVVELLCEPINTLADRWRDGAKAARR